MAETQEGSASGQHFKPLGHKPLTIPDGHGGSLTAIVGVRYPTADGYGQRLFFWHDTTFIEATDETDLVEKVSSPSSGTFAARFSHYAARDAECCPSLPSVTVLYHWDGSHMVANGAPPVRPTPTPPTCMIGISETSSVFVFRGWFAQAFCDQLMATSQDVYRRQAPVTAPIACQYTIPNKLGLGETKVTLYAEPGADVTLGGVDACTRVRTFSTDALPTPTPVPAATATPEAAPIDPGSEVVAAVEAYHSASRAAYGPEHDASQVDATMTGTARDASLCIMRDRSDSLENTGSYYSYKDLADRFDTPTIQGDAATVVEHKHQILTVHKGDGTSVDQDSTYSVTYTLTRASGAWLVSDYAYVTVSGDKGSASADAKPCTGR